MENYNTHSIEKTNYIFTDTIVPADVADGFFRIDNSDNHWKHHDIFTIAENQLYQTMVAFSNIHRVCKIIDRKRYIKWYNPLTWFRWYWTLEVIE